MVYMIMFQAEVYTKQKIYIYRNGGIIPHYDEYAIKQAQAEGRFKFTDKDEHAFTAYGGTREETMKCIDRIAQVENIEVSKVEFIDV